MWAAEIRRADERSAKFKADAEALARSKTTLEREVQDLTAALQTREQEIQRLHTSYRGGQNFQGVKEAHDLGAGRQELLDQLDGVARLLGFPDFTQQSQHHGGYSSPFLVDAL